MMRMIKIDFCLFVIVAADLLQSSTHSKNVLVHNLSVDSSLLLLYLYCTSTIRVHVLGCSRDYFYLPIGVGHKNNTKAGLM
mmetsp:Transcript_43211/g.46908  ORF Transcript_43211/g.46908 Transcript_43211/m.46908 type:complete len:81 (+) Transcript_43211:2-244(+)